MPQNRSISSTFPDRVFFPHEYPSAKDKLLVPSVKGEMLRLGSRGSEVKCFVSNFSPAAKCGAAKPPRPVLRQENENRQRTAFCGPLSRCCTSFAHFVCLLSFVCFVSCSCGVRRGAYAPFCVLRHQVTRMDGCLLCWTKHTRTERYQIAFITTHNIIT